MAPADYIGPLAALLASLVAALVGFLAVRMNARTINLRNEAQIERVAAAIAVPKAVDERFIEERQPTALEPPEQRLLEAMERRAARRSEIQFQHYAEALRQSGIYFNISAVVGLVGFVLLIVGVALAFASLVEPGVITGVGGVLAEGAAALIFRQAAASKKDSQNNLVEMSQTGEREDNRQMALIYVSRIEDQNLRDQTVSGLARHSMALSDPRPINVSGTGNKATSGPAALPTPEPDQSTALTSESAPA
jgi:hypothetical protein